MKTFSYLWQYLATFFTEWELFQIKWELFQIRVVEKIKIQILCSVTITRQSWRLWDNVEKCGGAWEAADDNMAARRMLDW